METFRVSDTFSTGYGPNTDYSLAYLDQFELEAESIEAAEAIVAAMQFEHDRIYRAVGASDDDYNNAPCYLSTLEIIGGNDV